MKNISCACIVALFSYCSPQDSVQEPIIIKPVEKSWKLVYADEFDGSNTIKNIGLAIKRNRGNLLGIIMLFLMMLL